MTEEGLPPAVFRLKRATFYRTYDCVLAHLQRGAGWGEHAPETAVLAAFNAARSCPGTFDPVRMTIDRTYLPALVAVTEDARSAVGERIFPAWDKGKREAHRRSLLRIITLAKRERDKGLVELLGDLARG